jgi:hypothetical protein
MGIEPVVQQIIRDQGLGIRSDFPETVVYFSSGYTDAIYFTRGKDANLRMIVWGRVPNRVGLLLGNRWIYVDSSRPDSWDYFKN